MYFDGKINVGYSDGEIISIIPKMANRHGLIAGATGTGKTTTLRVLAESFSDAGVPVFLADVKGDLSNLYTPGELADWITKRLEDVQIPAEQFAFQGYPVTFWDIFGKGGIPTRTTISEMGPLLLSRLMNLNDTQTSLLEMVFAIADNEGLLLIDTKDLKAMLNHVADNAEKYSREYGNITKVSINVIIRCVVSMETKGADDFFFEPALNVSDWFQVPYGKGMINVLDSRNLMQDPTMYATFLLWMLSELFETLPEVGDLDKPRMVFFFDEAHLLFDDAPKVFLDKIEQVIKLIRSKGVGIFFITQSPKDIPDAVLSQLGNKIQHALRAYTPNDEKALKVAADSFRTNPAFDTKETISNLGTGEAVISVLDEEGIPGMVKKCLILPPQSKGGTISDDERAQQIKNSYFYNKYITPVDPESAYEFLERQRKLDEEAAEQAAKEAAEAKEREAQEKAAAKEQAAKEKAEAKEQAAKEKAEAKEKAAKEKAEAKAKAEKEKAAKKAAKAVGSTAAGTIGREVGKTFGSAVGGSFGKKLGGNLGASLGRSILGTFLK